MGLNFPHFEIILFVLSVVVVSICLSNSRTNWLEGSMLITVYFMVALGFWFEKVADYKSSSHEGEL
jgi:Ca2+:H+ antiporter